jgi:TonB family protein
MENTQKEERKNDTRGTLYSIGLHSLIFALMFVPIAGSIKDEPESTIVVELPKIQDLGGGPALGLPDEGQGNSPSPGKPDPEVGSPKPTPTPDPITPKPTPAKPSMVKPTPAPPPQKPVVTTEDPEAVIARRQQAETKRKAEEAKYQEQQVQREKQRAAEQARAEADAKARAEADAKAKFGNRFGNKPGTSGGGGTGTGQGNTGKPGNQGRPDGDPDSKVLDGVGRGAGIVNGFGGRKPRNTPRLSENSQKAGKVVVKVCIDTNGDVVSAVFQSVGSTSTDPELQAAAISNARQYKFAPGDNNACGSITYDFKLK